MRNDCLTKICLLTLLLILLDFHLSAVQAERSTTTASQNLASFSSVKWKCQHEHGHKPAATSRKEMQMMHRAHHLQGNWEKHRDIQAQTQN